MSELHPLSNEEIDRIAERIGGPRISVNKNANDNAVGVIRRIIEKVGDK